MVSNKLTRFLVCSGYFQKFTIFKRSKPECRRLPKGHSLHQVIVRTLSVDYNSTELSAWQVAEYHLKLRMPVFQTRMKFSANNENAISMIVWKKGVPSNDQATWSRALNCSKLDITVFQHIGPVWGYGVIAAQYRQCSSTLYCATFCHRIQISSMIGLVHTQQD